MWLMSTAPKTAAKGAEILFIFFKWLIFSLLKKQIREWRLSRLLAVETSRVVGVVRCNRNNEFMSARADRIWHSLSRKKQERGKREKSLIDVEQWVLIGDKKIKVSVFFCVERLPNFDNCFSIKALNGKIRKLTSWLRTSFFSRCRV